MLTMLILTIVIVLSLEFHFWKGFLEFNNLKVQFNLFLFLLWSNKRHLVWKWDLTSHPVKKYLIVHCKQKKTKVWSLFYIKFSLNPFSSIRKFCLRIRGVWFIFVLRRSRVFFFVYTKAVSSISYYNSTK